MPKRKAAAAGGAGGKAAKGQVEGTPEDCKWEVGNGMEIPAMFYMDSATLEGRSKVAGFDIDWTVIATASGRKFPTGPKDWKFLMDEVPKKLKALHDDGFRVIFFSNQGGIEKGKSTVKDLQGKINDIVNKLGFPVYAFMSTGENYYRKPSMGMWDHFVLNCNKGVKVDLSKSIYVGDAAGRAKGWAKDKPKDFSCTDRMFAANVGIDFKTPEEFFLGEKAAPFSWGSFDAKAIKGSIKDSKDKKDYASKSQEMLLMVGMPASGKSTFAKKYLVSKGYVHVNRDTLHTPAKCLKAAEDGLKAKKSVVVDNTNPSKSARGDYLNLAKQYKVPIRCFVMETPRDIAHHLNYVRQNLTDGEVRRIPDVGYNMFHKNFEEPKTAEGFSEVQKINFEPSFQNKRHEDLFFQWTA